ncbi:MAG TPA: hypothetical protein VEC60_02270 [Reyranella sp.]|nr:hypothetical protein [Reyranella sp.]
MKYLAAALAFLLGASAAQAQTYPDLRGNWSWTGKVVLFGSNPHHKGNPPNEETARFRDFDFTFVVTDQQGGNAWGYNTSSGYATREPMAWAMASDGKTGVATDTDGYYRLTVMSPDRMEVCYTHAGLSPSRSIVAACGMADRKK